MEFEDLAATILFILGNFIFGFRMQSQVCWWNLHLGLFERLNTSKAIDVLLEPLIGIPVIRILEVFRKFFCWAS